jgi:hypothetical protein
MLFVFAQLFDFALFLNYTLMFYMLSELSFLANFFLKYFLFLLLDFRSLNSILISGVIDILNDLLAPLSLSLTQILGFLLLPPGHFGLDKLWCNILDFFELGNADLFHFEFDLLLEFLFPSLRLYLVTVHFRIDDSCLGFFQLLHAIDGLRFLPLQSVDVALQQLYLK